MRFHSPTPPVVQRGDQFNYNNNNQQVKSIKRDIFCFVLMVKGGLLYLIPGYKDLISYATRFQFSRAPLSSIGAIVSLTFAYLLLVFVLQRLLKDSPPRKFNTLVVLHNILLSASSLVLLIAIIRVIFPVVVKRGIFFAICNKSMVLDNYLNFLYYINYLMKVSLIFLF